MPQTFLQRFSVPLVLLLGILAVSTSSIFIRYAQSDASSLAIAAGRLTVAALVLAPIALTRFRGELKSLSRREILLGLLSGVFLAIHFATWISSLEYTSIASSVVLVTTTPLWVALTAPFILREPIGRAAIIGLVFALVGGAIVGMSEACTVQNGLSCPPLAQFTQGDAFFGNFLALAGAWAAAGYLLIGRRLRAKLSLIPYIFVVYGMAAIVLIGIMLVAGESLLGLPSLTYVWIILLALVPQLLGHSSFNWALAHLPTALVSVTMLGEPIGSTVLAYFILNESPALLEVLGGVLILAGIYITASQQEKREIQEEATLE
jgi:drug/metabolite transporter (DMT)-like permease